MKWKNDPESNELDKNLSQFEKEKNLVETEIKFVETEDQKIKKKNKALSVTFISLIKISIWLKKEKTVKIKEELEESQMLNKMLKENLFKIEENQIFEEDEDTLKDKLKVDDLTIKLEALYKKLELENK